MKKKSNKAIWISAVIGFILGLIQLFYYVSINDFTYKILNSALVPFVILTLLGLFLGILVQKRLYIPLSVFLTTFLITALVNATIWEKGSNFYQVILSIPTPLSLFGVLISLMFTALFTYGIGILIIGIICFSVAYFSTRDIKDKPIKIVSIILIVLQILVLFYAIMLKTGTFSGLT